LLLGEGFQRRIALRVRSFGPIRIILGRHATVIGSRAGNADVGLVIGAGMRQPTTQALYAYWDEVRAGRLAPHRFEIEPARIVAILSETFMLQRLHAGDYRYRLAGTRLCELFGSELRGRSFLDGWSKEDADALKGCFSAICEQGAVGALTLQVGDQRNRLELEAILLPLIYGDSISRILGAMSGASTAHWFCGEPLGRCRLLRHEVIRPEGRPHGLLEKAGPLRHLSAPFQPEPSAARIRSSPLRQFRVLEGGRRDRKDD
jgi:hypothetical protein